MIKAPANIESDFRYERKFQVFNLERASLINEIKNHPAFFHEIFHTRQINNIYCDTAGLKYYYDNIDGVAQRKKVRVRWYGNTLGLAQRPKLEYKLKDGLVGDKWVFDCEDFKIDNHFDSHKFHKQLIAAEFPATIKEDLQILRPTLLNYYTRTYFQSADQKFRLTLDENLNYKGINHACGTLSTISKSSPSNHFVVELKYNPELDKVANRISKQFSFRLSKSSKYVSGIELTT